VAEPCEKEKKALDKATGRANEAEDRLNARESEFKEWEAEAQRALGSIGDCIKPFWHTGVGAGPLRWHTEGEYEVDGECVLDRLLYAWKLLDAAERFRSGSVYLDLWARVEALREEEEHRKAAYCECLNRQRPR
jgi:hypothetical protein